MRGTSGGGAPNSLMYALVHSSSDTKLSATAHRDSEPRHAKRDCRHQTIARHAAARHADIALRERGHRPTVAFLVIVTSAWGGRYLENLRPFGSATMGGGWFKEFCTPQAPHPLPPAAAGMWYKHPGTRTCTRLGVDMLRPLESSEPTLAGVAGRGAGAREAAGAGVGAGARAGGDGAAAALARGGGMTSSNCSSWSRPK